MANFELKISSAAFREDLGLYEAIQQFSPDSTISGEVNLRESVPLQDVVNLVATVVSITGGAYSTYPGVKALLSFLASFRNKFPNAPQATLTMIDGATRDVIQVEKISQENVWKAINQWQQQH